MIMNDATRAQVEAARPDASTWLGANAGSGKTRVLTDRVARLLLNEVEPQHILCLTYTKAAASEMQNRLFKRLGEWAMLEDTELRDAMAELGISGALDRDALRRARTLFALAIETPGGLKIQTIHSFCASLLRRFPLEAGVSPQFTEIEDRAADLLRADIVDDMAQGPDAHLVSALAALYNDNDFSKLTRRLVDRRDAFQQDLTRAEILTRLGQPAELTAEELLKQVFVGDEQHLMAEILPHLIAKGGNDKKAGEKLKNITSFDLSALPVLEDVFLTKGNAAEPFSAKIGTFPTKPTQGVLGPNQSRLETLMMRVEAAREARLSLMTAEQTIDLHRFAQSFISRYAKAKQVRGWLDFDDLILKARALLLDKAVAAWVLYRIDGGIDHILVDEAQDTSSRQWDIIEKLTDEFYSGSGARERAERTLFVVGDKKQSIYSFQGADPLEFDRRSLTFERKIQDAGEVFQHQSLDYSFRSSSAILRFVDTVFDPQTMPDIAKQSQHIAFKDSLPGRVDLWPLVEVSDTEEDRDWTDPLDRPSAQNHNVVLARKIAEQIKSLTDGSHFIPDDGQAKGTIIKRPVRPGDFLILVQRRSTLFSEIIRACKSLELPIAGADRLKVGAELAVKDLAALLSFLATPDDSLSLATALKSPLFGWTEQELFDLAHRRTSSSLWQAVRDRKEDFPSTMEVLNDLRSQIDFLRPYDLIERILTRHSGRKKLLARLGSEAEDGINALLTQALAYERNDIPSLTGFIEWVQTDDLEIKRQVDSASDQIRVMTVHGSKGLEAPIVILPETQDRKIDVRDNIIDIDDLPIWKPAAAAQSRVIKDRLDEVKDAELAERLRLLYVATTRAEKWLIIAAAGKVSDSGNAWYKTISQAMDQLNATEVGTDGIRRFTEGDWDGLSIETSPAPTVEIPHLDPVFDEPLPIFSHEKIILSPSDLGGAKALPGAAGEDTGYAMAYGTLVHTLLENLPGLDAESQAVVADQLTENAAPETAQTAMAEARAVLDASELAHIFDAATLAEVAVSGLIGNTRVHGVIDRLLVTDDHILLVDFKTNRTVPDAPETCPDGILRQMGAYAVLVSQIYPEHRVETAILWTRTAQLMKLPNDLVTNAMWQSAHLDAAGARS
ncbi:ATP-dependent DNA nuclease [Sulfitobacter noctilucicola]|uniref:DNA 3'-5' helicase n=1 Tax=Sulfitobacter noctilucicola TaxID=1342301 RepID=A0A7W6Q473_9RHOB|nr:double-strand break repair helicase AddA [Sulfitobacter noctilucicola]KIN62842.1 ATP-dependent DNA nuclease [Sulfitobacter noctilucicola]MBB4172627.1 ATP-dependent helicase/nuclease subunit A [Sulfitobacter noctilucicola]